MAKKKHLLGEGHYEKGEYKRVYFPAHSDVTLGDIINVARKEFPSISSEYIWAVPEFHGHELVIRLQGMTNKYMAENFPNVPLQIEIKPKAITSKRRKNGEND